jgi:hypothetical protein
MLEFNANRILTTIIVAIVIAIIAGVVMVISGDFLTSVAVFFILLAAYWLQGLADTPANPPMRAVPKFLGNYIAANTGGISLDPGLTWYPLRGLLFSYDLLDASQFDLTLAVDEWTPDGNKITINPFFIYIFNPDLPVSFIKAGGRARVEEKIDQRIEGRLREWISSKQEGPLTWQDALQSNGLGMDVVIEKLFPGQLPPIPPNLIATVSALPGGGNITLPMFIRYFTGRPTLPEKAEKKDLELKRFEVTAKKTLDNMKIADRPTWDALSNAVQKRVDFVENVKAGGCKFKIDNLGIIILGASIANITPDAAAAAAADAVAVARQDARVRTIKSDNQRQRIKDMKVVFNNDTKAATEAIQLLDKEVTKEVKEVKVGLEGDTLKGLTALLGPAGEALGKLISSKIH